MIPPKFVSSSTQIRAVRADARAPAAAMEAKCSLHRRPVLSPVEGPQNRSSSTTMPAQPARMYSGARSDHSMFSSTAAPHSPGTGNREQGTRTSRRVPGSLNLVPRSPCSTKSLAHPRDGAHAIGAAVDEGRRPYPHEGDDNDEQRAADLLAPAHVFQLRPAFVERPKERHRQHAQDVGGGDGGGGDAEDSRPRVRLEGADEDVELGDESRQAVG